MPTTNPIIRESASSLPEITNQDNPSRDIEDNNLISVVYEASSYFRPGMLAYRLANERTQYCYYPRLRAHERKNTLRKVLGEGDDYEGQKILFLGKEKGIFNKFIPKGFLRYLVMEPVPHKPVGFINTILDNGLSLDSKIVSRWDLERFVPYDSFEHNGPLIRILAIDCGIYSSLATRMIKEVAKLENPELMETLTDTHPSTKRIGTEDDAHLWKKLGFVITPLQTTDKYGCKKNVAAYKL